MPQMRGFLYGYRPFLAQTNEVGQNSKANMADPIAVSDLDDLKKKIRKESWSNPKVTRRNGNLSSSKSI